MILLVIAQLDFFFFVWGISTLVTTYVVFKLFKNRMLLKVGISNTKVQIAISFFLSLFIAYFVALSIASNFKFV
jgi:hypothetical protein